MLLDEIAQFLVDAGLGARGTDIWSGFFPAEPDNVIVLEEYGGLPAEYVQEEPGVLVEHPRLQLRVRDMAYDTGRTRIEQCYRALGTVHNETLSGTFYIRIVPVQAPFRLDRDANNRHHLGCNFQVDKALSV